MIKVLVVDDSALVRKLIGKVLTAEADFEIQFARSGVEALSRLAEFRPDVITLDIQMPDLDGLATLDRIMVERPCPVVMISSLTAEGAEATLAALLLGAIDFVSKPSGAVSLRLDEFGPKVVATVRAAAAAKIRSSHRLTERVRRRLSPAPPPRTSTRFPSDSRSEATRARATGHGLVLVGTSTGGPLALETLLQALPAEFPWPVLVAQHMPATFTGALARRLDKICATHVVEVAQPIALRGGTIYIGRGDADLTVIRRSGGLMAVAVASQADYPWHPSVDRLVRSALDHVAAPQLVGVLMTGMGNDGASAMARLRAEGGRTIAESEETAVVWGMPGELVKNGGADFVLPLQGIAGCLRELTP